MNNFDINNTDFAKIGFLVENLPSCRPLARKESGWSIYKPDSQQALKTVVAGEDLIELICEIAPLLRIQVNKLFERSFNDLNDWEELGRLVNDMSPGMVLVWLQSVDEWRVLSSPKIEIANVIGFGRLAYDALSMALPGAEVFKQKNAKRSSNNKNDNR